MLLFSLSFLINVSLLILSRPLSLPTTTPPRRCFVRLLPPFPLQCLSPFLFLFLGTVLFFSSKLLLLSSSSASSLSLPSSLLGALKRISPSLRLLHSRLFLFFYICSSFPVLYLSSARALLSRKDKKKSPARYLSLSVRRQPEGWKIKLAFSMKF